MSDFFSGLYSGIKEPDVVMQEGPLPPTSMVGYPAGFNGDPDGRINENSTLLGDLQPYAYGGPDRLSTQAAYLNIPHHAQRIVPEISLPGPQTSQNNGATIQVTHQIQEGDVAFIIRCMFSPHNLVSEKKKFARQGILHAIDPICNLATVNYILHGLQRFGFDSRNAQNWHILWTALGIDEYFSTLCKDVADNKSFSEMMQETQDEINRLERKMEYDPKTMGYKKNVDIETVQKRLLFAHKMREYRRMLANYLIQHVITPFGVPRGSDKQGGQHQRANGNRSVTFPVDFVTSLVIDGKCINLLNFWKGEDINAGDDLYLHLVDTSSTVYTLSHHGPSRELLRFPPLRKWEVPKFFAKANSLDDRLCDAYKQLLDIHMDVLKKMAPHDFTMTAELVYDKNAEAEQEEGYWSVVGEEEPIELVKETEDSVVEEQRGGDAPRDPVAQKQPSNVSGRGETQAKPDGTLSDYLRPDGSRIPLRELLIWKGRAKDLQTGDRVPIVFFGTNKTATRSYADAIERFQKKEKLYIKQWQSRDYRSYVWKEWPGPYTQSYNLAPFPSGPKNFMSAKTHRRLQCLAALGAHLARKNGLDVMAAGTEMSSRRPRKFVRLAADQDGQAPSAQSYRPSEMYVVDDPNGYYQEDAEPSAEPTLGNKRSSRCMRIPNLPLPQRSKDMVTATEEDALELIAGLKAAFEDDQTVHEKLRQITKKMNFSNAETTILDKLRAIKRHIDLLHKERQGKISSSRSTLFDAAVIDESIFQLVPGTSSSQKNQVLEAVWRRGYWHIARCHIMHYKYDLQMDVSCGAHNMNRGKPLEVTFEPVWVDGKESLFSAPGTHYGTGFSADDLDDYGYVNPHSAACESPRIALIKHAADMLHIVAHRGPNVDTTPEMKMCVKMLENAVKDIKTLGDAKAKKIRDSRAYGCQMNRFFVLISTVAMRALFEDLTENKEKIRQLVQPKYKKFEEKVWGGDADTDLLEEVLEMLKEVVGDAFEGNTSSKLAEEVFLSGQAESQEHSGSSEYNPEEVMEKIRSLNQQLETDARVRKLQIEKETAIQEHEALQEQMKVLQSTVAKLENKVKEMKGARDGEKNRLQEEVTRLNKEIAEAQGLLQREEDAHTKSRAKINSTQEALEKEVTQHQETNKKLSEQIEEYRSKMQELAKKNEGLEETIKQSETEFENYKSLSNKIRVKMQGKIKALETENKSLREELTEMQGRLDAYQRSGGGSPQELAKLQQDIAKLRGEKSEATRFKLTFLTHEIFTSFRKAMPKDMSTLSATIDRPNDQMLAFRKKISDICKAVEDIHPGFAAPDNDVVVTEFLKRLTGMVVETTSKVESPRSSHSLRKYDTVTDGTSSLAAENPLGFVVPPQVLGFLSRAIDARIRRFLYWSNSDTDPVTVFHQVWDYEVASLSQEHKMDEAMNAMSTSDNKSFVARNVPEVEEMGDARKDETSREDDAAAGSGAKDKTSEEDDAAAKNGASDEPPKADEEANGPADASQTPGFPWASGSAAATNNPSAVLDTTANAQAPQEPATKTEMPGKEMSAASGSAGGQNGSRRGSWVSDVESVASESSFDTGSMYEEKVNKVGMGATNGQSQYPSAANPYAKTTTAKSGAKRKGFQKLLSQLSAVQEDDGKGAMNN